MNEDPQKPLDRDEEDPPSEGSGATDDGGGGERAGLGKSEAEEKISKE